ncbi:MAG: hypothetical protein H0T76_00350 [Nannocystis sp.]|nr:hypothetical protein [Nannocystis sp.]MBA3544909.1 hypothetical protein [Nannocystis sp.]
MRRPTLAQLELPLAASSVPTPATSEHTPEHTPEPEPVPARLCARCGWYCPLAQPCPVCQEPPQSAL